MTRGHCECFTELGRIAVRPLEPVSPLVFLELRIVLKARGKFLLFSGLCKLAQKAGFDRFLCPEEELHLQVYSLYCISKQTKSVIRPQRVRASRNYPQASASLKCELPGLLHL